MIFVRLISLAALLFSIGCAAHPANNEPPPRALIYHLNGIGGARSIDRNLTAGIVQGGLDADVELYDWTGADWGMAALLNHPLHARQTEIVAKQIEERVRANPRRRIIVTCHSGGAGIVVWALEMLPKDVMVDAVVMLQPAVSPDYDLSAMLAHVRTRLYVFSSEGDVVVLGAGTKIFGTMDGKKVEAAGKVGFIRPAGENEIQYSKLVQFPYRAEWMRYENYGEHIGPMTKAFGREIVGPLLRNGEIPDEATTAPTSRLAASPATRVR